MTDDYCPHRGPMPGCGCGRWCNARRVPLPAGPCDPNCEYRTAAIEDAWGAHV